MLFRAYIFLLSSGLILLSASACQHSYNILQLGPDDSKKTIQQESPTTTAVVRDVPFDHTQEEASQLNSTESGEKLLGNVKSDGQTTTKNNSNDCEATHQHETKHTVARETKRRNDGSATSLSIPSNESPPLAADGVIRGLLSFCKTPSRKERQRIADALFEKVKNNPTQRVLNTLLQACQNFDWRIRSTAIKALIVLAKASPTESIEALLEAYKSSNWQIRHAIVKAVVAMPVTITKYEERIIELLQRACKDAAWRIRSTAVEGLTKRVLRNSTTYVRKTLIETLLVVLQCSCDLNAGVRQTAVCDVVVLVKRTPRHIKTVLEILLTICKDIDDNYSVIHAITDLVKAAHPAQVPPHCIKMIVQKLIKACDDASAYVRHGAIIDLTDIAKKEPRYAEVALGAILKNYLDNSHYVRRAALLSCGALGVILPQCMEQIVYMLLQGYKENNKEVNEAAAQSLESLIRAAPTQTIEALLNILNVFTPNIRRAMVISSAKGIKTSSQCEKGLEALLCACNSTSSSSVQSFVTGVFIELFQGTPEDVEVMRKTLLNACNTASQRCAAVKLKTFIKAIQTTRKRIGLKENSALSILEDVFTEVFKKP